MLGSIRLRTGQEPNVGQSKKKETACLPLEVELGNSSSEVSEPFPLRLWGGQEPEGWVPHPLHSLNCSPQLPPSLTSPLPRDPILSSLVCIPVPRAPLGKARME